MCIGVPDGNVAVLRFCLYLAPRARIREPPDDAAAALGCRR